VYTWVVPAMLSFFLCRFTTLPIITIYLIVQFSDIIKLFIGLPMVKSGFWTKCVISDVREE
jgi:Na+-driven multidrug efflux pump